MVALRTGSGSIGTRGRVVLGSLSVVMLGMMSAGGAVAQGSRQPASATAPVGTSGALSAVAAVPHSSDVWTTGAAGTGVDHDKFFVARRHHNRWQRVKTPNLGGRFGNLNAVAAASAKAVWIAGARQVQRTQALPAIWRWTGKRFRAQKLPKLFRGAAAVRSMSASSSTNAWAVGSLDLARGGPVALHWNGKKWSGVAFPGGPLGEPLVAVSTSSASNAWALRQDGVLVHWNGKVWSEHGKAPGEVQLVAIATSSPKLAYAVGFTLGSNARFRAAILRFNGKRWSRVRLAKGANYGLLLSVAMTGRSAWTVGSNTTAREFHLPVLLHSTGGPWKSQQSLGRAFALNAVSSGSGGRAYAVGSYTQGAVVQVNRTFFELFDGHSWQGAPSEF